MNSSERAGQQNWFCCPGGNALCIIQWSKISITYGPQSCWAKEQVRIDRFGRWVTFEDLMKSFHPRPSITRSWLCYANPKTLKDDWPLENMAQRRSQGQHEKSQWTSSHLKANESKTIWHEWCNWAQNVVCFSGIRNMMGTTSKPTLKNWSCRRHLEKKVKRDRSHHSDADCKFDKEKFTLFS